MPGEPFLGNRGAANDVAPLQNLDFHTGAGQVSCRRQPVMAGAQDDYSIVLSHGNLPSRQTWETYGLWVEKYLGRLGQRLTTVSLSTYLAVVCLGRRRENQGDAHQTGLPGLETRPFFVTREL